MESDLLVLSATDLDGLLSVDDHMAAARDAFAASADGRALPPGLLHVDPPGGELHVKLGGFGGEASVVALKAAGTWPANAERDLPVAMGTLLLLEGDTGRPLALLHAGSVGPPRTAAASTLAATLLARPGAHTLALLGAGTQAELHARFLAAILDVERVVVWSRRGARAEDLARRLRQPSTVAAALDETINVDVGDDPAEAAALADVIVTCTHATQWFLPGDAVRPGTFIAAVGADSPGKQELEPALVARATVVVDVAAQARAVGELQHQPDPSVAAVHASLGEVLTGTRPGRTADDEIIVFDSTGTGLQDAAAARAAVQRATERGVGTSAPLFG
ncbi:MAG: ornithine cyclodeaminase family protein [Acidimicrobiia bacterium]|nr:ornithine cyclodeaminase family protein [Acidimicrobiia bacterium]